MMEITEAFDVLAQFVEDHPEWDGRDPVGLEFSLFVESLPEEERDRVKEACVAFARNPVGDSIIALMEDRINNMGIRD